MALSCKTYKSEDEFWRILTTVASSLRRIFDSSGDFHRVTDVQDGRSCVVKDWTPFSAASHELSDGFLHCWKWETFSAWIVLLYTKGVSTRRGVGEECASYAYCKHHHDPSINTSASL